MINWAMAGLVAAFALNGAISRLACGRVGFLAREVAGEPRRVARQGLLSAGDQRTGRAQLPELLGRRPHVPAKADQRAAERTAAR